MATAVILLSLTQVWWQESRRITQILKNRHVGLRLWGQFWKSCCCNSRSQHCSHLVTMLSSLLTDGIWGLEKSMLPPESSHLINCVLSNSKNTAFSCVVFQCQGRPFVACGCGNQGRVMSSALDNPLELLFHQPKHWPQKISLHLCGRSQSPWGAF